MAVRRPRLAQGRCGVLRPWTTCEPSASPFENRRALPPQQGSVRCCPRERRPPARVPARLAGCGAAARRAGRPRGDRTRPLRPSVRRWTSGRARSWRWSTATSRSSGPRWAATAALALAGLAPERVRALVLGARVLTPTTPRGSSVVPSRSRLSAAEGRRRSGTTCAEALLRGRRSGRGRAVRALALDREPEGCVRGVEARSATAPTRRMWSSRSPRPCWSRSGGRSVRASRRRRGRNCASPRRPLAIYEAATSRSRAAGGVQPLRTDGPAGRSRPAR